MLASDPIVHEPPCLLADVRQALSLRPHLAEQPRRLVAYLKTTEQDVRECLEALTVEDEVLS